MILFQISTTNPTGTDAIAVLDLNIRDSKIDMRQRIRMVQSAKRSLSCSRIRNVCPVLRLCLTNASVQTAIPREPRYIRTFSSVHGVPSSRNDQEPGRGRDRFEDLFQEKK